MRKLVVASLASAAVLIVLSVGVAGVERWIRADPARLPPSWQVRRHAVQLAQPVLADDDVGFLLPINMSETVVTDDYTFTRTTDEHGFPNAEPWPARVDIVFLGDSLLMGEGVGVANSFAARVDAMLEAATVRNLGNPGAGPERQYRIYRRFGAPLEPRLVVACLYLASDLMNDRHFRAWLEDPLGMEYNRFRLTYRRRAERSLFGIDRRLDSHPLYGWAQSVIEPRLPGSWRMPHVIDAAHTQYLVDRAAVEFARSTAKELAPELDALWASLEKLRTLVEGQGQAQLAVMLIPSREELFAAPLSEDGAVAAVKARLAEWKLPVLDLYPILRSRDAEAPTYFVRDIHLSRFGNEVVAEAFVEWRKALVAPSQ